MELSFTSQQLNRISILAKEDLSKGLKDKKVLLDSKMQKLKELILKMENLEEKMINNEIETITYKKWFTKLSAVKASLEIQAQEFFEKPDKALPHLTNLKTLYNSVKQNGKQSLLKRWFEGSLIYDGNKLRTPRLQFCINS